MIAFIAQQSFPPIHTPPTREWSTLIQYASSIDGYGQLMLEIIWYLKNLGLPIIGILLALIWAVTWRG